MNDIDWMRRALELAPQGRGFVEPNPLVGAMLVRDGVCVGAGWHQRYGEAHAEVNALAEAGERARGATLYVTLEPCCHHGKTPPCTDAVIGAGVTRVVAAMADPFPKVAGGGLAQLRAAGVQVELGLLEADARKLNAPYLTLLGLQRPYVHAKWAMTLDGKIATRTGNSKWISGDESRSLVHALRGRMDAIIVGAGTVRADDPQLTARPAGPRTATRIVLSHTGTIPEGHLLKTAREIPAVIAGTSISAEARRHLESRGCELLPLDLPGLLRELGRRRMTNVLVEGGAQILGAFRDAGLIDEIHCFIGARLVGGATAPGPFAGVGAAMLADGLILNDMEVATIGPDVYLRARVDRSKQTIGG